MTSYARSIGSRRPFLAAFISLAVLVSLPSIASAEIDAGSTSSEDQIVPWGGRTFSTDGTLARWLRARGASYEIWATAHVQAAARLEGRPTAAPAPAPTPAPTRRAPDWTAFNLPVDTTIHRVAATSDSLIDAGDLTVGMAIATSDPSAATRQPASTPSPIEENLALLAVGAATLIALLLFVIAGVTGIPSLEDRTPALIVSYRPQLAAGGISILLCSGLIFVLTASGT